ncbi:hypothetical protein D3Z58_01725 [Clostridiaceae bacterium]|nr:hypothetical protein [Clostridiaceae bacterium]
MARTSRKQHKRLSGGMGKPRKGTGLQTAMEKVCQTALYVRLSVLDSGKKDSDIVETQEALLRQFLEGKPCFSIFDVYVDNGETGVDFKRDGFERLMEDVRAGRIDCIVVKDLSRFGRNYIEAGEYLEKVFPFLGVRFIAVNDGYDSADPASADGLSLHLKNLVNDVYARDISAKISPALRGKQMRGEFIGTWAAYGYIKSKEDKHKIVVDPNTAPVVRDIFAWRLVGTSYQKIARRLTEQGIPSPGQYRYMQGIVKDRRFADSPWRIETVKQILANEVYLGHMVQGRKRESLFQGQKQKFLPREEWFIVRNTHEAVIDQKTFDEVQKLNSLKKQEYWQKQERFSGVENTENLLKGLVYCGDCGTKLVRYKNIRENKRKKPQLHIWYNYICPIHAGNQDLCGFGTIRELELLDTVSEAVNIQVSLAEEMERKAASLRFESPARQERGRLEIQISEAESELRRTKRHRESLYDDYADRLMSERDYIYAQNRYKEKEAALQERLSELKRSCQSIHEEEPSENPWLKTMLRFRGQTGLTREMAAALIEKIIIYSSTAVKIEFRFSDAFRQLEETLSGKQEETA